MSYARQQTNKWKKRAGVFALLCAVLVLLCAAALAAGDPVEVTVQADPASFSAPGDMQVVIQVKNTGAEDMRDPVTLLDPAGQTVSDFGDRGAALLSAGQTVEWRGTYHVTEKDLDAGQAVFTVQYNLEDADGSIAACTQQAAVKLTFTGEKTSLSVKRTLDPEVVRNGKTASVTYELYNAGNVNLTTIKVTETLTGKTQTVDRLTPGETKTLTFSTRMGNQNLKSRASITYKAAGSSETLTEKVEEVTIPVAAPNLSVQLEQVGQANVGEPAVLRMTFVNAGNVSYSNVTVKDYKKGEMFTGVDIPAGATVTQEKEITLDKPDTFKFIATLHDNTGETREMSTDEVKVQVFDPEKSLTLTLNLTCDHETVTQVPATVRFTLNVTNNAEVTAKNVSIRHGDVRMYTIGELASGQSISLQWDVAISQAGKFRFTAYAQDGVGNDVTFESNTLQITYSMPTEAPTEAPIVTVPPLVTVAPPTQADVNPVLTGAGNLFLTVATVLGVLCAACAALFAVSTAVRAGKRRRSENAYDHLDLAGSRDYTETRAQESSVVETEETVMDEDDAPAADEGTEEASVEDAPREMPHEKLLNSLEDEDAPEPEVTVEDVIDHKVAERNAAPEPSDAMLEDGFRVSRDEAKAQVESRSRRRAVRSRPKANGDEEE